MKYNVKIDGKTYLVEIQDLQSHPIIASVDGDTFEVWPEETTTLKELSTSGSVNQANTPISKPGESTAKKPSAQEKSGNVAAPIPGVVIAVNVNPGDRIQYGQELCVLEAMKMKNTIRAGQNQTGTVKTVLAKEGEHVQQGQLLIELQTEDNL